MSYTSEGLIQLGFEWEKDFCIYEDYGLVWKSDQPQPTEAECEVAKAEYDAAEYQRLRAPEYPAIGDQLDALFHAGVFPAEMAAKLQAVKDKYPK
jgi:hypothetical protein